MELGEGPSDVAPAALPALDPHVIVLFGATGDLARRKLLPGLLHLSQAGLMPEFAVVGTSLDHLDDEGFRDFAKKACGEFAHRQVTPGQVDAFVSRLTFVISGGGPDELAAAVGAAENGLNQVARRLHYLSIPPAAAGPVVRTIRDAGLADRAQVIMEKPFGT